MLLLLGYPQSLPFFQVYTGGTGDRGERDHISYTHEIHAVSSHRLAWNSGLQAC